MKVTVLLIAAVVIGIPSVVMADGEADPCKITHPSQIACCYGNCLPGVTCPCPDFNLMSSNDSPSNSDLDLDLDLESSGTEKESENEIIFKPLVARYT